MPVHGSIGRVACESCGAAEGFGAFCDKVRTSIKDIYGRDPPALASSCAILCVACGQPTVKPTTVLFGASLPEAFFSHTAEDLPAVDLLIVAGTSLVVSPANSIVSQVSAECVRLVVNREQVGEELGIVYGEEPGAVRCGARVRASTEEVRDVFGEGECDAVFLELATLLGWLPELQTFEADLPPQSRELLQRAVAQAKSMEEGR